MLQPEARNGRYDEQDAEGLVESARLKSVGE